MYVLCLVSTAVRFVNIFTDPWPSASKGRNCFASFFGTVICTIVPCYGIEVEGMNILIKKYGVRSNMKKRILSFSSIIKPSILMSGFADLDLIFFESHSLVSRPRILQSCWPKVMSWSFFVEVMILACLQMRQYSFSMEHKILNSTAELRKNSNMTNWIWNQLS